MLPLENLDNFILQLFPESRKEGSIFVLTRRIGQACYQDDCRQENIRINNQNVLKYISANSRDADLFLTPAIYKGNNRTADNISALYCFWAEFDFGFAGHRKAELPFADKKECKRRLHENYKAAGMLPNIVMNSGHGLHCYWLVKGNIVDRQTLKQIEQVNEWLYQIGIGIDRKYYNEVRSCTSFMRSPYPAVNRKIGQHPVATKMIFPDKTRYPLKQLRHLIALALYKGKKSGRCLRKANAPIISKRPEVRSVQGDIDRVERDEEFIAWLSNSCDLCYYRSTYVFDSTSHKETWVFKYLYLFGLTIHEIYEFCNQYMDRKYHLFRTRRTVGDRIKRIRTEIANACRKDNFPQIKNQHRK